MTCRADASPSATSSTRGPKRSGDLHHRRVLVVLFLVGAYRMMGAGASVDEDPKAVLDAVLGHHQLGRDSARDGREVRRRRRRSRGATAARRLRAGTGAHRRHAGRGVARPGAQRARACGRRVELVRAACGGAGHGVETNRCAAASLALRYQGAANLAQARSAIEVSALP